LLKYVISKFQRTLAVGTVVHVGSIIRAQRMFSTRMQVPSKPGRISISLKPPMTRAWQIMMVCRKAGMSVN
jgi:hypothetical protein